MSATVWRIACVYGFQMIDRDEAADHHEEAT